MAITPTPQELKKFWSKVRKTDGCWIWKAAKNWSGYGHFGYQNRVWLAHRVSYLWKYGSLTSGLVIDHICMNPACVNPEHLREVTSLENSRYRQPKTRCGNGHDFTPENTYITARGRSCWTCKRILRERASLKRSLLMAEKRKAAGKSVGTSKWRRHEKMVGSE